MFGCDSWDWGRRYRKCQRNSSKHHYPTALRPVKQTNKTLKKQFWCYHGCTVHFICCGWVNRYFSKVKGEFCEDVLGLTQIHGHTRGKDIYEAIKMLNERGIDIQTAVSIATDGLPESLLQGKCSFCCFTLDGRVAMLRIPRIGCTWIEYMCGKEIEGQGVLPGGWAGEECQSQA